MGAEMRRFWGQTRLRNATLWGLGTALVAVTVIVQQNDGEGHLAENRAQLEKACKGTLPYRDLQHLLPDDVPGELSEHGTMLTPHQESRSLLDCSLTWGGGRKVTVHAEALVSEVPEDVDVGELAGGDRKRDTYVAPGITGQYGAHGVWLVTECEGGLSGRTRPTTDLYVTATVAEGERDRRDQATALAGFRTAVQVANAVTREQDCGGNPLPLPAEVVQVSRQSTSPGRDQRKCQWMDTSAIPLADGPWTTLGDVQESGLLSVCEGEWDAEALSNQYKHPKPWRITGVTAASWSGVLGRTAYGSYEAAGHVPDWGEPTDNGDTTGGTVDPVTEDQIPSYVDDPQLGLWAQSVCDGGPTYHRISIAPYVNFGDSEYVVLEKAEHARLHRAAQTLLDRYLTAPDGWPKAAHCRDTKVLGESEEWH